MGLGFTVLPNHAVVAFRAANKICVHRLPKQVTETIYVGCHINKYISNRVDTVINAVKTCLQTP